jgi:hypothetical protein
LEVRVRVTPVRSLAELLPVPAGKPTRQTGVCLYPFLQETGPEGAREIGKILGTLFSLLEATPSVL